MKISIMNKTGEDWFKKEVVLVACIFCGGIESLVVSDVFVYGWDRSKLPLSVHCGDCGAMGPWGWTELEAVDKWNCSKGIETKHCTEWVVMKDCGVSLDAQISLDSLVREVSFAEFQEQLLRKIACCMDVPYDLLIEDYRKTDYSMGVIKHHS